MNHSQFWAQLVASAWAVHHSQPSNRDGKPVGPPLEERDADHIRKQVERKIRDADRIAKKVAKNKRYRVRAAKKEKKTQQTRREGEIMSHAKRIEATIASAEKAWAEVLEAYIATIKARRAVIEAEAMLQAKTSKAEAWSIDIEAAEDRAKATEAEE